MLYVWLGKGPAKSGASIYSPRGSTRKGLAIISRPEQHLVAVKLRVIPLDYVLLLFLSWHVE